MQNLAGGGGWLGWGTLAAAARDGYTLGYLNVPSMYAGYLDPKVGRKESLDSFTPLMNHVIDYNIWAVKPDSPFRTVKDVIDAAKKTPESITVTAYGAGSDDHLAILGISAETDTKFVVIHSRSTAEDDAALNSWRRAHMSDRHPLFGITVATVLVIALAGMIEFAVWESAVHVPVPRDPLLRACRFASGGSWIR